MTAVSDSPWVPSPLRAAGGTDTIDNTYQSIDLGNRVKLVTTLNPWLRTHPEHAVAIAKMNLTPDQLVDHSTALGGMLASDNLRAELESVTPGVQRAVWGNLRPEEQAALQQQGYKYPKRDDESFLDALGPVGTALSFGVNAVSRVASPVLGPALNALGWVGDQPSHLYRAIRMLPEGAQHDAALGAIVGGLALAAAVPTGGGSLAALGVLGAGALAGGTAGAIVGSNPTDWARAFSQSWNGERTFDLVSQRKANELLGDTRLVSLAHDFALRDVPVTDIARKFAEKGGIDDSSIKELMGPLAERVAARGTPEFSKAIDDLASLVQQPVFQQAVQTLVRGKISVGRDFADSIGLSPSSTVYNVVSGGVDGIFQIAVDPTLMIGEAAKWNIARRRGMALVEGAEATDRFLQIQRNVPGVRRLHELVADGIARGDWRQVRQLTPAWRDLYMNLSDHAQALVDEGLLASRSDFGIEEFNRYVAGNEHLVPLLSGRGTVQGARGVILKSTGPVNESLRRVSRAMRAFSDGLADPKMEKRMLDELNKVGREALHADGIDQMIPADLYGVIDETGFIGRPWLDRQNNPLSYEFGRVLGHVPGGSFVGNALTAITTMVPEGHAIALAGEGAAADVHSMTELGRVMGMPSWARRQWEQAIMEAPNIGMRRRAAMGWLDNALTISGAKTTDRGQALVARYLHHEQAAYALGGQDSLLINGSRVTDAILPGHMAMEIVMPDLHQLRRTVATGFMAHFLNLADMTEPFFGKVWRPAILMRVGFVPRAAGEEMLNFATRGGLGGIVQGWGARAVARHDAWLEASERAKAGLRLTDVQRALVAEGPLAGHTAFLGRALDRVGWGDPRHAWIDKYASWLRERLRSGVGLDLPSIAEAGARGGALGNLESKANAIILGSPTSWRRMLVGGVNDDLLKAALAQTRLDAGAIARAISNSHAGPFDRAYDREGVQTWMRRNDAGEWEDVPLITVKGEHDVIGSGDPAFQHGIHETASELLNDPVLKPMWAEHLPRIRDGAGVTRKVEERLPWARAVYANASSTEARMILDEFLGAPLEDSFKVMLGELTRVNPELGAAVRSSVTSVGQVDYADVVSAARRWAADQGTDAAREVADQIAGGKGLVDWFDGMPLNRRRFGGAHLKSRSSAPFYRTYDEAYDDMLARTKGLLTDARNQAQVGRASRGEGLGAIREGQVLTYVPPRITPRPIDGALPTFDNLVAMSDHPEVLYRNRDTVERILEHDLDPATEGWVSVVGNRQLADELTAAQARWTGTEPEQLQTAYFGDRILRSGAIPATDAIAPLAGPADGLTAWSVNRASIESRLAPVNPALDDEIDAWARTLLDRGRQVFTRGTVETYKPRVRVLADGTTEPVVFRNVGGKVEPVTEAERFTGGRFVDARGNEFDVHDRRYFEPVSAATDQGEGSVMWELTGPMLEDVFDDLHGAARWAPKQHVHIQAGIPIPSGDLIRVYRSRVEHVQDVGAGLANAVVVPRRTVLTRGGWSEFVRKGFDNYIGPAIDALARRPMYTHFFADRYTTARKLNQWTVPDEVTQAIGETVQRVVHAAYDAGDVATLAGHARAVARINGERRAAQWSDHAALSWLRGHTEGELVEALTRAEVRAAKGGRAGAADARRAVEWMNGREIGWMRHAVAPDVAPESFVHYAEAALPIGALEDRARLASREVQDAIKAHPVLRTLTDDEWAGMMKARRAYDHIDRAAAEWARSAAVNDMMPFIDSHTLKTQFAESARPFMPFWYAEENFMRRWARTVMLDPTSIRKAQLGYMGLKHAGVVRTDANGRDWFVYPGSGALQEAMSHLPGLANAPTGLMFQSPTDMMLPGINNRFGAPQFSPLVGVPLDIIATAFPDVKPIEQALMGDYSTNPAWQQLIPTTLQRFYAALTADEHNQQYASAYTAAIAQMAATTDPDKMPQTPLEMENFLRTARNQARIVMFGRALMGFLGPGSSTTPIVAGETASFLGNGVRDPKQVLSSLYYQLVSDLGIEEGTTKFMELYPLADLHDVVNPTAFTVSQSTSPSGAPLPATHDAAAFYASNADYFSEFPDGAPWLLPMDPKSASSRSGRFGADEATINALRKQRTPEEFYRAILFKQGSEPYFASRDEYQRQLEQAHASGDDARVRWLNDKWATWSASFKATHPVFAEELETGDGRTRRQKVLTDLRTIVRDPEAPQSPQLPLVRNLVESFDHYTAQLGVAREDDSAFGRQRVDWLKNRWQQYLDDQAVRHPEMGAFITGVLAPESSLT